MEQESDLVPELHGSKEKAFFLGFLKRKGALRKNLKKKKIVPRFLSIIQIPPSHDQSRKRLCNKNPNFLPTPEDDFFVDVPILRYSISFTLPSIPISILSSHFPPFLYTALSTVASPKLPFGHVRSKDPNFFSRLV